MEPLPVRDVVGFGEVFWLLRTWSKKLRSGRWARVLGVVEGHELLLASNVGWLVVLYSYDFQGECFSGEFRKRLRFRRPWYEDPAAAVAARFPRGTKIGVRVNPEHPAISVADL